MATGKLYESVSVILGASGGGTARVGPLTAREVWSPITASVAANANPTNEAQCKIYVGLSASAENFRDITFSGSSGDSSGKVTGRLSKGNFVFAVWSGGDIGATATLIVTGDKEV
jgi:hypothetical protein